MGKQRQQYNKETSKVQTPHHNKKEGFDKMNLSLSVLSHLK